MIRPRDRASANGLLPRMEARPRKDGLVTYRYHPLGGKPVKLGTDKLEAIQAVLDMNGRSGDAGTFRELWRLYQEPPEWKRLAESSSKDSHRSRWGREPARKAPTIPAGPRARVGRRHRLAVKPAKDIYRYMRVERADAPIRANRELALLSNLFKVAVERGDIDANPCKEVSRNPEEPRTRLVEEAGAAPVRRVGAAAGRQPPRCS
jgi:hypothetical protein